MKIKYVIESIYFDPDRTELDIEFVTNALTTEDVARLQNMNKMISFEIIGTVSDLELITLKTIDVKNYVRMSFIGKRGLKGRVLRQLKKIFPENEYGRNSLVDYLVQKGIDCYDQLCK